MMVRKVIGEPKVFYFGETFYERTKLCTRVCQEQIKDENVFACEESLIRKLEKLLQENVKLLTKGRKVVHIGKKS